MNATKTETLGEFIVARLGVPANKFHQTSQTERDDCIIMEFDASNADLDRLTVEYYAEKGLTVSLDQYLMGSFEEGGKLKSICISNMLVPGALSRYRQISITVQTI